MDPMAQHPVIFAVSAVLALCIASVWALSARRRRCMTTRLEMTVDVYGTPRTFTAVFYKPTHQSDTAPASRPGVASRTIPLTSSPRAPIGTRTIMDISVVADADAIVRLAFAEAALREVAQERLLDALRSAHAAYTGWQEDVNARLWLSPNPTRLSHFYTLRRAYEEALRAVQYADVSEDRYRLYVHI